MAGAPLGVGPLGLKDDDLGIEAENFGKQGLLVIRESSMLAALSIQFTLEITNAQHQIPFVETLQWVVRGAGFLATRSSSPSTCTPLAAGSCRYCTERVGRFTIKRICARVSTDDLEAESSEAWLQIA